MIANRTLSSARSFALAALACLLGGCATNHVLMPTPATYTGPNAKPLFADASSNAASSTLDLLFLTDRAAGNGGNPPYTAERSRSIAFGSATVEFGGGLSLGRTTELGRFPPIPYQLTATLGGLRRAPSVLAAHTEAKQRLQSEIARRLADARRKEVVLFVHGYHVTFEDAALTSGEMCHFLGREFVCGVFTWPAGGDRGLYFGYGVDRESAEYAVEDLVKLIRIVAATPGVERIHFIAHSRGTDTVASALAALSAESYALKSSPTREFRIGNVALSG